MRMQFGACQLNVNISNINVIATNENCEGIFEFDASNAFGFDCNVNVANISVYNPIVDDLDIIAGIPYKMHLEAVNLNATGDKKTNKVSTDMAEAVRVA